MWLINTFVQGHVKIFGHVVDRLKLQSAKLNSDSSKCALQSCLFSIEEMVNGNPLTPKKNAQPSLSVTFYSFHGPHGIFLRNLIIYKTIPMMNSIFFQQLQLKNK